MPQATTNPAVACGHLNGNPYRGTGAFYHMPRVNSQAELRVASKDPYDTGRAEEENRTRVRKRSTEEREG
jgi:hypothetical protein